MIRRTLLLALTALSACSGSKDDGPIAVSVIAPPAGRIEPDRAPLTPMGALLLGATAQGLVRFDGAGQIEPGVADRWDVSDDGLYYTFRIADRSGLRAEDAAKRLRAAIAPASRNPLKPVLGAIGEVVAVTPQVIEMRMRAPRPNLLQLLAQPELSIPGAPAPLRVATRTGGTLRLAPPPDPDRPPDLADTILLRRERPARAVARFAAGDAQLVLGGRFADLAVAQAARLPQRALRVDPAKGLFGLAFVRTRGILGSVEGRRALAMAIDRAAVVQRFAAPGWQPVATLVPPSVPDLASPATPDWIDTPVAQRRALARASVAAWTAREGVAPRLTIHLPPGPGSRLLLTLLRLDWAAIGVALDPVRDPRQADLRLVDAVAPADISSWYLRRFTCETSAVCSEEADRALAAAREAPTLLERGLKLVEADARFAEIVPFIPLASPLRWSLAAPRLTGFQENPRAVHPLDRLIADR